MKTSERIYTTCTRDCPNTCGLTAVVEAGRLVKLKGAGRHPLTQGHTCIKAARYVNRVYSPERVRHPMMRTTRKSGAWQRATWNQVFDRIAETITTIVDADGPEAILYYQGYGERTALKLLNRYFFNLLGGVTTLRGSLCGGTGQASQNLDLGDRISHDPLDHYNSNAMILWGRNPASTNISLVPIIRAIKKRGGTIILVDPYKNRSAALADRHIAPVPGRDVYLAMAAAKQVYAQGAEARPFLENHCLGADRFKALLDRFSVDELFRRAGVSRADAHFLADVLITRKPASILLGWGLHRHEYAHYSIRAIDALAAICGNIGVAGGGVSQGFEEYGPYDPQYWGDHLNPPRRTLLMPAIGDEIQNAINPKIRMIFVTAANPVCMAPRSDKVARAFANTEFVVYSGHFLDDTADQAHVFLPATTFLEEQDVMATYGHNYVGPVNRAIAPVGECRSEFEMFCGLADRFAFGGQFRRSVDDWLHDICAPIRRQGCSMAQLKTGPFRLEAPMAPYMDGIFPTASGKFEFMTEFDPEELKSADPDYPLTLLTVAPHHFICSERTLAEHPPLPVIRMHPQTAAGGRLRDNGLAIVSSPVGQLKARLKVDPEVRPDCLVAERGGWIKAGHGLNRLTPDRASRVGDGTPYYDTRVSVRACMEEK
ncbi:catalytic subunit of nitrate reductase (flp) [Desulfosarcina ovata subsp. sediminis]|uniref:Catalytic subunit of nitrate reductase (Flp) n=1 Tax=Desulfosarcina ovata subsp. sediminis TaxID=885957 RepID=A0A5K7ZX38_9BACT|nr:molybdopterin-dependent oxidoreductase [Desulfosarcina ovata]BBO84744.1 catalytic subunit of nitrate reductase (flp) [Desulfosarcina ovata subsp. sediminis]